MIRPLVNLLKFVYTIYVAIIFVITLIITLPFFFLFAWTLGDKSLLPIMYLCRFIAYCLMIFCGIIYRFHPNKNINKKKTYVIISNHRSNLDAPTAAVACWGRVRYLAKTELLKIPLLGQLFSVTTINVDRSSRESKRKSFDMMKHYLLKGDNIFIFPEGTRNKTENDALIPFKDGAFSIAIQTQTPILPILIINTDKLMPNKKPLMQPGIIDIYYFDPIDVTGLTETDLPALKERVREMMRVNYNKLTMRR
ncbi:MAG: lysophospholipid acyltransferase family protein [Chitinophagales bacterium]